MTAHDHAERTGPEISRRTVLGAGAALVAAGLAGAARGQTAATTTGGRRRVLRFAHPTDIHVQPELHAGEGMRACFEHMLKLEDPPAMIITGGDLPMDTASTPEARSRVQWDLFKKVLADTVPKSVPIYHTLGNHDVFGRDKVKSGATGQEAFYGKKWFLENFGYERTYRSFDAAGWHFVMLDSIHLLENGDDFVGKIAGEQLDWLKDDLARTPATTPTLLVTHVPIISVANYFDRDDEDWKTDGPKLEIKSSRMHTDCRDLDALLCRHRNVKLCLSGHLHLLDRCDYNGVAHICDGAVSGAKWKGSKRQTPEGYGLIDLYDDGTFEHRYMTFGWRAEATTKAKADKVKSGKSKDNSDGE